MPYPCYRSEFGPDFGRGYLISRGLSLGLPIMNVHRRKSPAWHSAERARNRQGDFRLVQQSNGKNEVQKLWAVLSTVLLVSVGEASEARSLSGYVNGHETPQQNAQIGHQRNSPCSRPVPSRLHCSLLIPPSCHGSCIGTIICVSPNDMTRARRWRGGRSGPR